MANSMRNFIEEMKQKQMASSQPSQTSRNLFVMPMRARFLGNTGTGENSQVEPNKPVAMTSTMSGPRMLHEGENMYSRRDGSIEVVPASNSQDELAAMERTGRIPGYALGGTFMPKGSKPAFDPNAIFKTTATGSTPTSGSSIPAFDNTIKGSMPIATARNNQTGTVTNFNPAIGAQTIQNNLPENISGGLPARTVPTGTENVLNPNLNLPVTAGRQTPATGLSYGQQGMEALSQIAKGGSPALKAAQDKYLQDLKATQNVSDRVAGFENAQANVGKEVGAARQAMGRAIAGSQLGQAESQMAANEMQQMEQANADLVSRGAALQGMEMNQQNQIADLIGQGYTKEQINGQLGTTIDDAQYNALKENSDVIINRGMNKISALLSADPYMSDATISGIQSIASGLGIPFDGAALKRTGSQTQFNDAMKLISNGIASNMTSDQIKASLDAAGLSGIVSTAFPQGGVSALIDNMNPNVIDKEWNDISNSGLFKGLPPELQSQFKTVWTALKLGGGTDLISFDKDGNIKMNLGAVTGTTEGGYDPAKSGTWSDAASAVIKAGVNDPNYETVFNSRVSSLISNDGKTITDKAKLEELAKTPDDPVYKAVVEKFSMTPVMRLKGSGKWHNPPKTGDVVKYDISGIGPTMLKAVKQINDHLYVFTTLDGKQTYTIANYTIGAKGGGSGIVFKGYDNTEDKNKVGTISISS